MIEVESRASTESSPAMAGRAGRQPVLMKMVSAVSVRAPPALSVTSTTLGAVKRPSPKMSSTLSACLQPTLARRAEVVDDGLLAPADLRHVHGYRTAAHAVVGGAPGQVGDAGAGDHGLGRRAADIDARAADVLPFDDRGPATGAAQVQGQWFSRLAGAQDDRVKTLRLHDDASTTKKSCAVVTLSAGRNRFSFYALIAGDEPRSRQGTKKFA